MTNITRLLVVLPSWIGDSVMATPALRAIRAALPDAHITVLARPGLESVLHGCPWINEFVVGRAKGLSGTLRLTRRLKSSRCDTAILFPNSFSTALVCRLAGIPRRIGYDRDRRGFLLTDRCSPPRRDDGRYAVTPAVTYYLDLVRFVFGEAPGSEPVDRRLELWMSDADREAATEILRQACVANDQPIVVLNPGANRLDKRWPADRFATVADHLARERGAAVLVTGSPGECDVVEAVRDAAASPIVDLTRSGVTLSSLKAVLARASLLITNDTGPRHIAAAVGTPVVTLFGPTDPRWTTLDFPHQVELIADPTLVEGHVADDHAQRCDITKITVEQVIVAANQLLACRAVGDVGHLGQRGRDEARK
ncbi:MAG: lipopolysaccharide heptosyltransferase II [Phycisphaerales bacterium]|nr:lipopolysaccharide heptosyltransferase II [Phycisphaerales bacterium]